MKAKVSKLSVALFLIYLLWYREAKGHVSLFLYGGTVLVAITTLIYINRKSVRVLVPPKGILYGIGYGVYSLIVGIVVAADRSVMMSALITYFAFFFVCYCITIICQGEGDIDWLLKTIVTICVVCAVYTLFWGYSFYNGIYVITMGPENNPNALGAFMTFGIFAVLYQNEQKLGKIIVSLAVIMLFVYIIILTGSRKSLFSALALCIIWFIVFLKDTWQNCSRGAQIIRFLLAATVFGFAISYFSKTYLQTASFERLLKLFSNGSASGRWEMYIEAGELFKKSKLFGIGFNQFRVLSSFQTYSHSTYAEVLACGGIFGCLIYFTPIVWTGWLVCKQLRREKTYRAGILFALYAVEMFLGAVNIFLYTFMHMMMWTIIYILTENKDNVFLKYRLGGKRNV